jgi:DNA-binding MarR family transcriptional regulator
MSATRTKPEQNNTQARTMLERNIIANLAQLISSNSLEMAALLAEHDLSLTQHNALMILRRAADGLPSGVVGDRLLNKESDVTRLLDRMEKQGLIVRSRDQTDRRVVMTRITEYGLAMLTKLDEPLDLLLDKHFAHVATEKLEAMLQLIQEVHNRPT